MGGVWVGLGVAALELHGPVEVPPLCFSGGGGFFVVCCGTEC